MKRLLAIRRPASAGWQRFPGWFIKSGILFAAIHLIIFPSLLANRASAQDMNEVKVTLELKNEPLKKAFEQIEKQTSFRFAYNKRRVEAYRDMTISIRDIPVQEVMEMLLANTALSFKQVNNKIIIFNADEEQSATTTETVTSTLTVEDGTVKGKIIDEKGDAVSGASILIQGGKGSAANALGEFVLTGIKPGSYKLQVTAVGYAIYTRDITITDGAVLELTVNLAGSNNALNEVIVTGYSKQSKRDVTGAVSTISEDVIAKTPVSDVSSILQGRVSGVTVDGQGGPGADQKVRIRGIGTIGDNDPLFVIDGVQTKGGLNLVNPNDIESITVLKDAASCSLYGARGSNGVIVITTKRGKTGAPRLEYNSYVGAEMPRKFPDMLSPQQIADQIWLRLKNSSSPTTSAIYGSGATPVLPDYLIGRKSSPTFLAVAEGSPEADPSLYNLSSYRIVKASKAGTNWFDELFDPAITQSHQLALSGATDKNNYAVTFNYLNNRGVLKESYFNRYSVRANTEFKIKPWLRVGENLQFAYTQGNTIKDHTDQNVIAGLFNSSPLLPVYDIAGNIAGTNGMPPELADNPYVDRVNSKNGKGYSARLLGSAYVELEPLKNLVFQTKAAIDYSPSQTRFSQDTFPQLRFPVTSFKFSEFAGHSFEWRVTNKLSYAITINDIHQLSAFVAYETSLYTYRSLGASSDSMLYNLPGFQQVNPATGVRWQVSGNQDKFAYISQIGNINYSLLDKYLASFTIRRDGTSRFTDLRRYGVFPSASIGWRISKENFMNNIPWVNDLKLRASLGTSGNDNIATGLTANQYYTNPIYTYYDLAGANNAANLGFALSQLGNPLLQWEENQTTNIGFDASLFNNRLTLGFNWFDRKTDKLLYNPPITAIQGDAGVPFQNIMSFTNKGIELEAGWYGPKNKTLSYEINANISTYRNNVTYIDGMPKSFITGGLYARAIPLSRSTVGEPVSSFYGYEFDGMEQEGASAGHFKFRDISGPDGKPDGIINNDDRTFIGSPHPKFSYGFNLNLYYKSFDFSMFIQGVYGNKIFNYWRAFTEWPGKFGAGSIDTWTPENTDAKLPINSTTTSFEDDRPSTFFVEDGSYLRLKNLQVGYTLPKINGITKLRVYAQAYNLLTITKYSGMDPEVNTGDPRDMGIDFGGSYPISMKLLLGINLTL